MGLPLDMPIPQEGDEVPIFGYEDEGCYGGIVVDRYFSYYGGPAPLECPDMPDEGWELFVELIVNPVKYGGE